MQTFNKKLEDMDAIPLVFLKNLIIIVLIMLMANARQFSIITNEHFESYDNLKERDDTVIVDWNVEFPDSVHYTTDDF